MTGHRTAKVCVLGDFAEDFLCTSTSTFVGIRHSNEFDTGYLQRRLRIDIVSVRVRRDSNWSVPEPEFTLAISQW